MRKSLKEIWLNRVNILEGIKNSIFAIEHIEIIAEERLKICRNCVNIDEKGSNCLLPGSQPCCGLCGCKLSWKVRALSEKCDDNKWEALLTPEEENEIKLKLNIDQNCSS